MAREGRREREREGGREGETDGRIVGQRDGESASGTVIKPINLEAILCQRFPLSPIVHNVFHSEFAQLNAGNGSIKPLTETKSVTETQIAIGGNTKPLTSAKVQRTETHGDISTQKLPSRPDRLCLAQTYGIGACTGPRGPEGGTAP